MKVTTNRLMVIAGFVWMIAGINILRLGVQSYFGTDTTLKFLLELIGSIIIFGLFYGLIFSKMVAKHTKRIGEIPESKTHIWKFFDLKGYIIMAVMMTFGISLRVFNLVPEWFIAFFYTGLGCALALAGSTFHLNYFRVKEAGSKIACPLRFFNSTHKTK